jgi:hypothetical protein
VADSKFKCNSRVGENILHLDFIMPLCQVGFFVLPGKYFLKSYQEHTLEIIDEHYFDDARYWKAQQVPLSLRRK